MKKNKLLIGLLVVAIAIVGVYFLSSNKEVLQVDTMKSSMGSITKKIEITGTINSDDIEIISLPSNVNVINTYVKENDLVEENKLLAELDSEDLVLSLEKAKLNIQQLKSDLNSLYTNNTDSILLENEILKKEEEFLVLSNDLTKANEDLQRAEVLYDKGAISQVELEEHITNVDNINSKIKTTELSLNDTITNQNNNKEKKEQNIASLQRQIETANLDIDSLNTKIKDSKIYSSISGYITEYPIEASKKTQNNDKIVIHGANSYEFIARVAQQDAILIKEGQIASVKVDGLDTSYEGQVSFISKVANIDDTAGKTPKIEIKIKILIPDEYIKFGYEGSAIITVDSVEDTILLKNECVRDEAGKKYVFIVENNTVKKAYVETGLTDGYQISIIDGIDENDIIVVNPPMDLKEGANIKGDLNEIIS